MENFLYIKLSNIDEVKAFVKIIAEYEEDINIYCGGMDFDAKSIMSIMSIYTNSPNKVEIVTDSAECIQRFIEDMSLFKYE